VTDPVPLIDCREAAKRLCVCEATVRRYGHADLIDQRRIGPWLVRYTEASVMALKAQQRSTAA
jgi:hypothetical protein